MEFLLEKSCGKSGDRRASSGRGESSERSCSSDEGSGEVRKGERAGLLFSVNPIFDRKEDPKLMVSSILTTIITRWNTEDEI